MSRQLTTKKFIEKAIFIHGDRYDYSLVEYISAKTNVIIICHIHGEFPQTPSNHTHKSHPQGCPDCYGNVKLTTDTFIKKANLIHNYKFDYSLVNYINNYTKVKIICPIHGEFESPPYSHFKKNGCMKCYRDKITKTTEQFITDSIKIHKNKYDYSLVNYINSATKVRIICPIHSEFKQIPNSHLMGKGCDKCHDEVEMKDKKLYILYDNKYNLYKIGYSKNIKKRKRGIEYFLKYKLIVVKIFENKAVLENHIHKLYIDKRVDHPIKHGGHKEWFNINEDIVNDICQHIINYINK